MSPAINIRAIVSAVEAAEEAALEDVANHIVADARARAPIRKVFREAKGFRRKFRPLTAPERNLAIRRAMAYQGYNDVQRRVSVDYLEGRIKGYHERHVAAEKPRRGSANSLKASRTLRTLGEWHGGAFRPRVDAVAHGAGGYVSASLNSRLTGRGKYEVRSGRAVHEEVLASGAVSVHIGGALKASIESEGVVQSGQGSTVKVTAGIRYAKFVEFPTTHNASQPFLLPALHGARGRLKATLAAELRKALGG